MSRHRIPGEYHPLVWDGDGTPAAHYVNGHVSPEEFRAAIQAYFGDSSRCPGIPPFAKFEHVYVRAVRVGNEDYGNRHYEWRHTSKGRGFPMTYWEVSPNRNIGA
jgi:hypothetical protein